MREYLLTLLLAAALCYVVTPLVRTWAIRFGAVAQIRTRDVHTTPTPRWGGLAMWISMSITFAIVNNLELVGKSFGRETQGIFLAGTFLVALGMLDDRFELVVRRQHKRQLVGMGFLGVAHASHSAARATGSAGPRISAGSTPAENLAGSHQRSPVPAPTDRPPNRAHARRFSIVRRKRERRTPVG